MNSLEPEYDARTLEFHHGKHHSSYVSQLNSSLKEDKISLLEVIQEKSRDLKLHVTSEEATIITVSSGLTLEKQEQTSQKES
jgi:superoxide dismutase